MIVNFVLYGLIGTLVLVKLELLCSGFLIWLGKKINGGWVKVHSMLRNGNKTDSHVKTYNNIE